MSVKRDEVIKAFRLMSVYRGLVARVKSNFNPNDTFSNIWPKIEDPADVCMVLTRASQFYPKVDVAIDDSKELIIKDLVHDGFDFYTTLPFPWCTKKFDFKKCSDPIYILAYHLQTVPEHRKKVSDLIRSYFNPLIIEEALELIAQSEL